MAKVPENGVALLHRRVPKWLREWLINCDFLDWKALDSEFRKLYLGYQTGMGRPPVPPYILVKGLLMMVGMGFDCFDTFCWVLRNSKTHRLLIGCEPPEDRKMRQSAPSAATFRLFFRRLVEGPVDCYKPRGVSRLHALHKHTDNPDQGDKVVVQKAREVMGKLEHLPTRDFFFRCQLLLDKLGVSQSRALGILPKALDVALDGSVKWSYAHEHAIGGKCRHFDFPLKKEDIPEDYAHALVEVGLLDTTDEGDDEGDKKRVKHGPAEKKGVWVGRYSDPTAAWGHSNTRNLVFGHRLQGLSVYLPEIKKDLPLALSYAPASVPDSLMGVELLARYQQYLHYSGSDMRIREVAADKAYDVLGIHLLLQRMGARGIIPLREARKKEKARERTEAIEAVRRETLLSEGYEIPEKLEFTRAEGGGFVCPAGLKMKLHQVDMQKEEVSWMCPAMKCVRDSPTKTHWEVKPELCPLGVPCDFESRKMGPMKRESLLEMLQNSSGIPRGSEEWKKKANRRTSIERFWSYLVDKVGEGFSRRGEVMFMKYLAAAILKHWKVIFEVKGG